MSRLLGASISQFGLKIIATVTMLCYLISKTILQRGVINLSQYNTDSLLSAMANGSVTMQVATYAVLMELLAGVSVTIYAFLLVEGFQKTGKFTGYLINVAAFALASEIPYNYAFGGEILYIDSQNPMFALAVGLLMLCAFRWIQKDSQKHTFLCCVVTVAGMAWCYILHIEFGVITVLLVSIYYYFRENRGLRIFLGWVAGLPYITGIIATYPLFIYSGKRGCAYNKYIFYVLYPLMLIVCGVVTGMM